MKKFFSERKIYLTLFIFFLGFFIGTNLSSVSSAQDPSFKYLDFFHFVYQTIKLEYVEEAGPKKLFYGAIDGMVSSLEDPYSRFLDEKEYSEFFHQVTGEFVGVGIEITTKDNQIVIISPIDESPAKRAGIQAGDRIVQIDDTIVRPDNINDVIKNIKGKPETTALLKIKKEGYPELLNFSIKRAPVKVSAVKYGIIKEKPKSGYLKITNFYSDTHLDVRKALLDLEKKGVKSLILDLRNNPGGNLETSIHIADYFLPKNSVIVSTRGKEGSGVSEEYKAEHDVLFKGDILILVNEGSASASEVLSGALQDNKRAVLAGETTFGKALVQRVIDIEKGKTGFALTIRKYYTPSGKMIHKAGIKPDYFVKQDIITENDKKNLGRIFNDKLIEKFARKYEKYNEENIELLISFLKSKNVPLSKKVAAFYYKFELNRDKPDALYDLEFDNQLKDSLKYLK